MTKLRISSPAEFSSTSESAISATTSPLLTLRPRKPPLEPLPYPPVDRDFAFIVDAAVPAGVLLDAVRGVDRRLIREVRLFDVYLGPGMGEGRKSLALAVRLQAPDRTLAEAEIEAVAARIVAAAEKAAGAVLRG